MPSTTEEQGTLPGKRYVCAVCGGVLLCTKPGRSALECCGQAMDEVEPKPMPSAD